MQNICCREDKVKRPVSIGDLDASLGPCRVEEVENFAVYDAAAASCSFLHPQHSFRFANSPFNWSLLNGPAPLLCLGRQGHYAFVSFVIRRKL